MKDGSRKNARAEGDHRRDETVQNKAVMEMRDDSCKKGAGKVTPADARGRAGSTAKHAYESASGRDTGDDDQRTASQYK